MADSTTRSGLFEDDRARVAQTQVQNPNLLTLGKSHPALRKVEKRLDEIERPIRQWKASLPYEQFRAQCRDEFSRLIDERRNPAIPTPKSDVDLPWDAQRNVKKRWVEQGIWNTRWKMAMGKWKHEEPLDLESDDYSEAKVESGLTGGVYRPCTPPPYELLFGQAGAKPKQAKSDEELAERKSVRMCQREASRPFYQFLYEVSKERERIQHEMSPPRSHIDDHPLYGVSAVIYGPIHHQDALDVGARSRQIQNGPDDQTATIPDPHDINTMAYERAKESWIRRDLWNANWGILPGMSWQHEQPFNVFIRERKSNDTDQEASTARDAEEEEEEDDGLPPAIDPDEYLANMFKPSLENCP
ncbi:hypothetical protein QQX98_008927 [Neonectria punicea]|uniref:Uncharacterized protein n=1 Tax=Neonectria punicea TaxID=979145 RepID=A0ABR1GU79_9HYPO